MSKVMDARAVREAWATRRRFAMLEKAGIDPAEVGKVFNRASGATIGAIPTSGPELEELLADQGKMRAVFAEPGKFAELVRNYAAAVHNKDSSIATQVREETQRVLTDWLRENEPEAVRRLDLRGAVDRTRHAVETLSPRYNAAYNPEAMGAKVDAEYLKMRGSADFFRTAWHNADKDNAEVARQRAVFKNAFSETVPSEGGFLVPEVLRAELLRVSLETSIVRPRARVIPMDSLRVPFPAIDTTSNVSSVYGGIVGYWTEEGAALTISQAAFSRVVLDAKKLTAYTEVPNELIADSAISFQAFIDQIFPEALGFYEDYGFMRGTGVGEPLGFINCPAAVSVTAEAGQATGTIVWENLVKMFARMLPSSLGRAVWIASIDTFPQLATMALSVGTGGAPVWLANGQAGPPMTILGRPVIFTEKVPGLTTTGDISFVDLGFYLVGDRQAMSVTSSEHYKFGNDQTAFRVIERVDGRPWLQSAITPKNNTSSLSAFVQIATR